MSQKALEATVAKPADHQAPPAQPKWDVSNREMLSHIQQNRVAHTDAKVATATVPTPPHREVSHPAPPQGAGDAQRLAHQQHQQHVVPGRRPDIAHPANPPLHQEVRPNPAVHPPQVAQNPFNGGRHEQPRPHTQNPTEINRTVINNNNQRYDYANNNGNNNSKYLYGGLAGGALLGSAGAYYANNNQNHRNWNNYNQYNTYNTYDQYNTYDRFALNPLDQYGLNQYDQYRYPNALYDRNYGANYADYDPALDGNVTPDYLYGGTTYGSAQFDDYNRPIYETTIVDSYRPIYRDRDPIDVIPQLFGNLISGVLGTITSSHHNRRYNNPLDC